jgi:autotransporter-associated beta strand protein
VTTFDVSGHSADLLLNQLVVGRRNASSSPAQVTNDTFRWDRGTLDVQSPVILEQAPASAQKLHVGQMVLGSAASTVADTATFRGGIVVAENRSTVSTAAASVTATLSVAGGQVTAAGITLGDIVTATAPSTGTRQANATLEVTGGSLSLTAPLRSGATGGPGTKTAVLTLNGGTLDLGGNAIGGTGAAALTTLNFQSGTLANVGSINGTGGLNKTTAGTLTLAGANTFTGPVAVNAGTLQLDGSVSTSLNVASGATLVGGGSVVGNVTLSSGSTLRVRLDSATSFDQITLTGENSTITLGATLEIVAAPDLPAGTRFRILRNQGRPSGAVVGTFAGRPAGELFTLDGRSWYLDYAAGAGGDVDLVLASPLELWRHTHFGSVHALDAADPERDGLVNLLEYALGTNPNAVTSPGAQPEVELTPEGYLRITFLRARADITYVVEAGSDLINWTPIATNPGTVGEVLTVVDTVPVSGGSPRFLRLRVSG